MKFYLDSSFIVEVINGNEAAITLFKKLDGFLYTSQLGRTEVIRTFNKLYSEGIDQAYTFLESINLLSLDAYVLEGVERYGSEITLGTADAIHVSSAQLLLDESDALVTFDMQMANNAKKLGLQVITS